MYVIKRCSDITDVQTHKAFCEGFADYQIKVNIDLETFINRFFGCEGNSRELSFVAFKNDIPIGVTLGGIKTSEEMKTLRCGGMSVIPSERGTGVAQSLMEHHKQAAIESGCKQIFLEVLESNYRAIKFYKKLGYEKVYNLTYRKWELNGENPLKVKKDIISKVEEMSYSDIYSLRDIDFSHLPWQSEFMYFKELPCKYYGIKDNGKIIAGTVATKNKVIYLWVHPKYRIKGYATALLNRIIIDVEPKELHISYANNSMMHTFCNYLNMGYDPFSQLEMYKSLRSN